MSQPSFRNTAKSLPFWTMATIGLLWSSPGLGDAQGKPREPHVATLVQEPPRTPTFSPTFSAVDRWHLRTALDTAQQRLDANEACRALFDSLDLGSSGALGGTLYEPATGALASAHCRGGSIALTVVGGQRTRLCKEFWRVSRNLKAAALLHEAMHRAGQPESPPTAAAPTAREITRRVRAACEL